MQYIDMHVHLPDEFTDEQIRKYVNQKRDKEDIVKILLIGKKGGMEEHKRLLEVCAEYDDFFIPFPWLDLTKFEEIDIEQLFEMGSVGLKFLGPLEDYDHEMYFPLYQKAEDLGMMTLFHTGVINIFPDAVRGKRSASVARMKPEFLDTIGKSFPDLVIHGAHLGNPWYEISLEIMRYNRNLHWDLCGTTLTKKMTPEWWNRIQWETESRKQFLYGTDEKSLLPEDGVAEHFTTGIEVHKEFIAAIEWSEEEIKGYFFNNAFNLLKKVYKKQGRDFK